MVPKLVFWLAKACQMVVRRLGRGGGTALPGLLADRLSEKLLPQLIGQLDGVIVVIGTNGKTTTSRLLSSYLEGASYAVVHNRSGSNLVRGILSSLIADANWTGKLKSRWGLFEVDEAAFPQLMSRVTPDYVLALNLFRDQLDRYGEVDSIADKWRQACALLPKSTKLILNADDPLIAYMASQTEAEATFFGLDYDGQLKEMAAYADSRHCPVCGSRLIFDRISYSHLGSYRCPQGDFVRPHTTITTTEVSLQGMSGSQFNVQGVWGKAAIQMGLAGVYNIYNVTAAMAIAAQMGLPIDLMQSKTRHFEAVFGRLERIRLQGTELVLILAKNPTGFNQVIHTLQTDVNASNVWLLLNDRFADGRDISWIWDVEFERLATFGQQVYVSGSRAYDMAVRLKYAGLPIERLQVLPSMSDGLRQITHRPGETVYCLCTYTAMLELRQLLQKNRVVGSYHGN